MWVILQLLLFLPNLIYAKDIHMNVKFDVKAFQDKIKRNGGITDTYVAANGNTFNESPLGDDFYIQRETQKHGIYCFHREFYKNGNLKKEGKLSKYGGGNTYVGEMKSYSENGALIETKDFEKNFKVHYEDVLEICKKKNIDLNRTDLSFKLHQAVAGQTPAWLIEWETLRMGAPPIQKGISIDAITGIVTETTGHELIDH
jgi:hypothetical protein